MDTRADAAGPSYGMTARLKGISLDEARARVTEALKTQGFGILTEIDVRATFKKKLEADFRPYYILGACNPTLAHRALGTELAVGLMLPCNVCVWQEEGAAVVSIVDPRAMFQVVDDARLRPVVDEADRRLRAAFDALQRGTTH